MLYEVITIFGPTEAAAQLEGSKAFTKDFLARHKIPTADYQNFTEIEPALAYLQENRITSYNVCYTKLLRNGIPCA